MQGEFCTGHRACPLLPFSRQPVRNFPCLRRDQQQQQRYCRLHGCRKRSMTYAASAEQLKPAYNKYRSRNDIQQSYVRDWQKTTARDGTIKPQTILSTLWFVPIWLKYHAVPDILRYAWYIVWVQIVAVFRRYHTWAVLQGAKLDLELARRGNVPMQTFSRSLVMRRWHHRVSMRENFQYRWRLYKGQTVEGEAQSDELQAA